MRNEAAFSSFLLEARRPANTLCSLLNASRMGVQAAQIPFLLSLADSLFPLSKDSALARLSCLHITLTIFLALSCC
jgi:hypothetical protein